MGLASQIIAIFALLGMFVGLIPCLGWTNWFVIPVAIISLVLGIIGMNKEDLSESKRAKTGLIISVIVIVIATIRWFLGGFIF